MNKKECFRALVDKSEGGGKGGRKGTGAQRIFDSGIAIGGTNS